MLTAAGADKRCRNLIIKTANKQTKKQNKQTNKMKAIHLSQTLLQKEVISIHCNHTYKDVEGLTFRQRYWITPTHARTHAHTHTHTHTH